MWCVCGSNQYQSLTKSAATLLTTAADQSLMYAVCDVTAQRPYIHNNGNAVWWSQRSDLTCVHYEADGPGHNQAH